MMQHNPSYNAEKKTVLIVLFVCLFVQAKDGEQESVKRRDKISTDGPLKNYRRKFFDFYRAPRVRFAYSAVSPSQFFSPQMKP